MTGGAFVPAWILHDPDISPASKLLAGRLWALAQKEGFCWASNAFFADEFSVDERTIQRWLNELVGRHFSRELGKGPSGCDRKFWPLMRHDRSVTPGTTPVVTPGTTDLSPVVKRSSEEDESLQSHIALDTGPDPRTAQFETLWAVDRRGNKKDARCAFMKAVPSRVSFDVLYRARKAFADSANGREFITHMHRWIKKDGWEEELAIPGFRKEEYDPMAEHQRLLDTPND